MKRKVRRQYPNLRKGMQPPPARQKLAIGLLLAFPRDQIEHIDLLPRSRGEQPLN